ncbi:MAG: class I tRNA ligase family protein, partial [Candidatus Micrarchaeota archaeon]
RKTKHLFFELPKVEGELRQWLESNDQLPPNARNFALGWLKDGLQERCITRDLTWGVKVPLAGYEDKVFYVWFDAPIGYISITKQLFNSRKQPEKWKDYWRSNDCKLIHFLGKDNVAFHTVLFPAMLIASKYAILPSQVKSFEFLNYEGGKFSTSRKYGIFTDEALDWFPPDYWRYYLLSILPEHSDADFVWSDFQSKVNNDLNDVLGNLVHRCLTFTKNNFDGKVPAKGTLTKTDEEFVAVINERAGKVAGLFDAYRIQEALREALGLAREGNKYFNDKEPWHAIKNDKASAGTTLYVTVNALRSIAVLLEPFIPFSSQKILELLKAEGLKNDWASAGELQLKEGHEVAGKIEPLFTKIEAERVEELRALIAERGKTGN